MASGIAWTKARAAWRRSAPAAPRPLDLPVPDLLDRFHPDRSAEGRGTLLIGPNAGQPCPPVLGDLLQSDSLLQDVDIAGAPALDADVLVIGGGGAGCIAALTAARAGARVLLATKLGLGDSNTVMAEGGIQAAVGADDSLQRHFEDTLRAGHFAADRELVAALVTGGPAAIRWLIQEGMSFDLADGGQRMGGTLRRKTPGGASAARLLSYRDFTGLELMRAVREATLLQPNVTILAHHPALELLSDDRGRCAGAVLHDLARDRPVVARSAATVLATGGSGRLHLGGFPTSNHYGATADGLVLAYRLGARLRDVDSFQYHPTGIAWPGLLEGQLISEAARSSGAFLVNGRGRRFVDELQPRDIVAAAILREIAEGRGVERDGKVGVLLDTPSLEKDRPGILQRELVTLRHLAGRAGFDPAEEPFLVRPTLHYQNGGVEISTDGRTTVPGLLAAGEVTGGLHGRNRMMGNALLELVVFGRLAGAGAAAEARGEQPRNVGLTHLADWRRAMEAHGLPLDRTSPMLFPPYGNFDAARDLRRGA
ncbi:MAG: FAD-binding protein [Propionicimonas sp.]|uniref:FAD-binding protein n=1 Tax=Propionicimonas sp. TaxID=1955623 RepID=UPI003D0AB00B